MQDDVIINLMMGSMSFGVTDVLPKGKDVGWRGFSVRVNRAIPSGVSDVQQDIGQQVK